MSKTIRARSKKIKWGIAGAGRFAEMSFIPSMQLLRKSKIESLFSSSNSRAKSLSMKFGIPKFYSDYDEFLNSGIDAVYIASANINHYEQVIKAAKAGKNIFCEKPIAITSEQADEMVKVCQDNKVTFAVDYIYRAHPLIKKAKELTDNQILGKIVSISLNFNIDFAPNNNYRFVKELSGGGVLRDLGTHMIDLLRFFGGEIVEINGFIDNVVYKSEVEDFAAAVLKFKESGYGYFNVSGNNKKAFNRIEILGHRGVISLDNLIGVKHGTAKLNIILDGEARKTFRKRANKMIYALKSIQKSFLKNEKPFADGNDGLVSLKLVEELERKCQTKKS